MTTTYITKPKVLAMHIAAQPSMVKTVPHMKPLRSGRTLCGKPTEDMTPLPPGKQLHLCVYCRQIQTELKPTP